MDEFDFQTPSIITNWSWDSNFQCEIIAPIILEQSETTKIELDQTPLIIRQRTLEKGKTAKSNNNLNKNQKHNLIIKESSESFLPAPIHKMTINELKQKLKSIGLSTKGTKIELSQRLQNFINNNK